jgi:hypothetical protein
LLQEEKKMKKKEKKSGLKVCARMVVDAYCLPAQKWFAQQDMDKNLSTEKLYASGASEHQAKCQSKSALNSADAMGLRLNFRLLVRLDVQSASETEAALSAGQLDSQIGALASRAHGAGGHGLDGGPRTTRALLEGSAADAVEDTLFRART